MASAPNRGPQRQDDLPHGREGKARLVELEGGIGHVRAAPHPDDARLARPGFGDGRAQRHPAAQAPGDTRGVQHGRQGRHRFCCLEHRLIPPRGK
jgi:hypothetical protein